MLISQNAFHEASLDPKTQTTGESLSKRPENRPQRQLSTNRASVTNYIGPAQDDAQKDMRTEQLSGTAARFASGIAVIGGICHLWRRDTMLFAVTWLAG